MDTTFRLLLIEDNAGDVRLIEEMLRESQGIYFDLRSAGRLEEALSRLKEQAFDALLLDLGLPDSQGLGTLARLRAEVPDVPIVVLTGIDDIELAAGAVQEGAQDYLVKGQVTSGALARSLRNAVERKRVEEALRKSEQRYRFLFTNMTESFAHCQVLCRDGVAVDFVFLDVNESFKRLTGRTSVVGRRISDVMPELLESNPEILESCGRVALTGEPARFESYLKPLSMWVSVAVHSPAREHFVAMFDAITERKEAEEAARKHTVALTALHKAASHLAGTLDPTRLAEDVTRACVEVLGAEVAWVGLARPDGTVRPLAQFPQSPAARIPGPVLWDGPRAQEGPTGRAIRTGTAAVVREIAEDASEGAWRSWALEEGFRCVASFPLISRRTPLGSLTLYGREAGFLTSDRVDVFQTFAHEVAAAMANARLFQETDRRLKHVEALHRIDRAITASLDEHVTFDILLGEVAEELRADAADILMLNRQTLTLTLAAALGFDSTEINSTALRIGEDDAGVAALEHRAITARSVADGAHPRWASLAAAEGFKWRAVAPLVTKGEVKGVLEVYRRTDFDPDDDWLTFLDTLAGQASLAIDSSSMFRDLQRSNVDLKLAYDATIEGWSRALDLRDKETEGHTQRVTELTLRLARAAGMTEEELANVRRGALLHDIGKVGVPDAILHKPGPLTDQEWEVMRMHPTYALNLLQPIRYLRPALDIPFAHHERWDGSGYPRGRKGEQIPLAARIFAVVDVWDALSSDRPYRPAWPRGKVRRYLREKSGKEFDPKVVEEFLGIDLEAAEDKQKPRH